MQLLRSLLLIGLCLTAALSTPLRDNTLIVVDSCSSFVYCKGKLLDVIQRAEIFDDSKSFVDMSQVHSVDVTLENFNALMDATGGRPTKDDLIDFVGENFISENETIDWTPPDYKSEPAILTRIPDIELRGFARDLIGIWPTLGRKISPDVYENPDRHSILEVPNGFIIPGGRFKELYYWDSYWIIKGMLLSEMYDTVRGMLENICHLIDQFGFMPNGSRLYYLNRSQPPLFTLMIQEYLKYTGNNVWLRDNIQCVERELTFWLANRTESVTKDGVTYELAHYEAASNTPRPESYEKDLKTCAGYSDESDKRVCYRALKTGAETGWDFSSRWFFDDKGDTNTNLTHIRADRVVPVDLNTFLCRAFGDLAEFYQILGDSDKQAEWQERSDIWKKSIENVFYDSDAGIWFDYDPELQKPRKHFYPSNYAPLWAETYDLNRRNDYGVQAAAYLVREGVDQFLGGIPTSLDLSGEQWDFRNAWPPLQEFVILGLWRTGNANATEWARLFAERWVYANLKGYRENQIMFEKYDAVDPGKFGGGGEYVVQAGFGWTNGVALSLIDMFYTNK